MCTANLPSPFGAGGEPGILGRACARPCRRTPEASRFGPERAERSQAFSRRSVSQSQVMRRHPEEEIMCAILNRGGLVVVSLFVAFFAGATGAQSYPSKPIRLVVPFPAGGPSDIVGRVLGQKLAEQLGQNVVPDNRPGAGGNLGIGQVAKAPPDGYTI